MVRSPWPWVTPRRPGGGALMCDRPWAQEWAWSLSPGRAQVPCSLPASASPAAEEPRPRPRCPPAPPFWRVTKDRSLHWCLSRVVRSRALTARATFGASGDSASKSWRDSDVGRQSRESSATPDPVGPPICSIAENSQGHTEKHRTTARRPGDGGHSRGWGERAMAVTVTALPQEGPCALRILTVPFADEETETQTKQVLAQGFNVKPG